MLQVSVTLRSAHVSLRVVCRKPFVVLCFVFCVVLFLPELPQLRMLHCQSYSYECYTACKLQKQHTNSEHAHRCVSIDGIPHFEIPERPALPVNTCESLTAWVAI